MNVSNSSKIDVTVIFQGFKTIVSQILPNFNNAGVIVGTPAPAVVCATA